MNPVYPMKARITAQASSTRVDVFDDIGGGGWFSDGVSAKGFAALLADVQGPLDVHINSYGGDVGDGIAIGNAIRGHKGFKRTIVDGMAASIASVIMQAGDERVVEPGSMVMIHDAMTACVGNAADMEKTAEVLNKHSDNLAGIYAERAGGTVEQWRDTMRSETWYSAEEAVAAGLADKVGSGEAVLPEGFDVAALHSVPDRIAAQLRTLPRAAAVLAATTHGPFTGKHTHAHAAYAAQGATHEHEHSHDGDADHHHDHPSAKTSDRAPARVLGIESMPIVDKAMPIHRTATVDEAWDGPAAVAAMPNDDKVLRFCHAWMSDEAASVPSREGDNDADDQKSNYKFPHHTKDGGPANLAACRNGLARLSSANIPDGDRAGVKAHLQAHLDDAAKKDGDGKGDTGNHAELPGWLNDEPAPLPAWLQPTAEEATQ